MNCSCCDFNSQLSHLSTLKTNQQKVDYLVSVLKSEVLLLRASGDSDAFIRWTLHDYPLFVGQSKSIIIKAIHQALN